MNSDPPLFCDIEASSLDNGFPIEVGWSRWPLDRPVPVTGSVLIRPHPDWLEGMRWSGEAEGLHGLSRDRLATEGLPPDEAARLVADALAGGVSLSDAPPADSVWLSLLMDAGGIGQRSRPRLVPADAAFSTIPAEKWRQVMGWADQTLSVRHRAGPDAERWARIWHRTQSTD